MNLMELHIHSTFSDGEQTPAEILQAAQMKEIQMLAFTDHDEIGAFHEVRELADELGIYLIPGIELNTDGADGELHILGYFFDPDHPKMVSHIEWRKDERKRWAERIIEKLQTLNYDVTFADVLKFAPGDIIVRTHIAKALVGKAYFHSAEDAYQQLLTKGNPAFVQRSAFSAKDAIALIHACGGEAYLAHPGAYPFSIDEAALLAYGIDGIEVYHSKHSEKDVSYWKEFTEKLGLLKAGGSDCHGPGSRNPYPIGSIQPDEKAKEHWLERVGVSG
ncbi:PHP domain-containing protein [Oceanobacillus rekensis]|uniref:PHP domain-containing protein n=1 Tax=Oceanobacillus rekensis TaxID=937927 RepID=UPI000B43CA58|nr:PHP domain-containing protein [Oceanobacillus rekensis]